MNELLQHELLPHKILKNRFFQPGFCLRSFRYSFFSRQELKIAMLELHKIGMEELLFPYIRFMFLSYSFYRKEKIPSVQK